MFVATAIVGKSRISFKTQSERMDEFVKRRFRISNIQHQEPQADLYVRIQDGYGKPFDEGPVHISASDHSVTFQRCDYHMVSSRDYSSAEIHIYDEFALKHALINLYSSWLIHGARGLLIHSSCVIHEGKAWMFAGQSGAGKSTVAELSRPRPILSDEATFLYIEENGRVTVYDSPFRSEMENPCELEEAKLYGIHYIIQSPDVERISITPLDGFALMLDKVFYWRHDAEETRNMIALCKKVVQQVPSYQLYFQKNDTFWERIS
ncbi:hypothetical protein PVOR_28909 [Paenibacillus vortex V453]|uniref:HPr kinase n=1 Tax=Paenibacillus vortex V453 TaxID=715225 RepID=A0A2R9SMQ6_9BACL|nr:hypothetical protein [Paenibacillus vortex]EFU38633.1 hypothetical protein PVOR_28909 [Paenibacillus vortex V453]